MHETHKWNIKCQNESCSFMSLSTDELKKHEKQTHVFIDNTLIEIKCDTCKLKKESGMKYLVEHQCESHDYCLHCRMQFPNNFEALIHMNVEHRMKVKCKYSNKNSSSCHFMSLSEDELKRHENQPHDILNDHDYTCKTAPNEVQVLQSFAKLVPVPKKNLTETEDDMVLPNVDAVNDGTSKEKAITLVEDTEKSVLDAINHNRCNFCNITFPQKSRFDDVAKHFADIHDIHGIKKGAFSTAHIIHAARMVSFSIFLHFWKN